MSAEWVRDHAAELGAIRAGGPRAPLRFEAASIEAWKERQRLRLDRRTPRPASRARRRRSSSPTWSATCSMSPASGRPSCLPTSATAAAPCSPCSAWWPADRRGARRRARRPRSCGGHWRIPRAKTRRARRRAHGLPPSRAEAPRPRFSARRRRAISTSTRLYLPSQKSANPLSKWVCDYGRGWVRTSDLSRVRSAAEEPKIGGRSAFPSGMVHLPPPMF